MRCHAWCIQVVMDVLEVLFRENGEGGVPFDDLVLKVGQGSRPSRDTYTYMLLDRLLTDNRQA